MKIAFEKLNGTGHYIISPRDVVYVEEVQGGGTKITTFDLKQMKVRESSGEVLRQLARLLETAA